MTWAANKSTCPIAQTPFPIRNMLSDESRASGDPGAMANAIQRTVRTLDPALPVYEVKTMDAWLDATRVAAALQRDAAADVRRAGACCWRRLASMACWRSKVARRTQEIGIRMALGATAPANPRLVMRRRPTVWFSVSALAHRRRRPRWR